MVKHTQAIRRQQPTNCLNVFDHFARFALKGFKSLGKASSKPSKIHYKYKIVFSEFIGHNVIKVEFKSSKSDLMFIKYNMLYSIFMP